MEQILSFNSNPGSTSRLRSVGNWLVVWAIALLLAATGTQASSNVAQSPLFMTQGLPPNILLLLDNSNTMVESPEGTVAANCDPGPGVDPDTCVAGAESPDSKSEISRRVARQLLNDYEGRINLGLMSYQQNPYSDSWSDIFNNDRTSMGTIGNRYYDVSYDASDYDPDFSGAPWDSQTKAFSVDNPFDHNHDIFYNVGVPGFSSNDETLFCTTREPGGGYLTESFPFRCFGEKSGTSNLIPNNNLDQYGYTNYQRNTSGNLNDSARARGVTHWGQRMVFLTFGQDEYVAVSSPGLGYLHVPIGSLEDDHLEWLETKLDTHDRSISWNNNETLTGDDRPVIVAGLTPLEGSLYTARDYFLGQTDYFGNAQGRNNAQGYDLPQTCDADDALIWLTDGMPSVNRDGVALGEDVDTALEEAVAAAGEFHTSTDADIFVMGFAMPPGVPDDALDQLASAGGTGAAYLADDETALQQAMNDVFDRIIEESRLSATTIATTSSRVDGDTATFQALFDSSVWAGDIESYSLVSGDSRWSAEERLDELVNPMNQRTLLTTVDDEVSELRFLDADQRAGLNFAPDGSQDDLAAERIAWLYGETGASELRSRLTPEGNARLLGSIVNSDPVFVGKPNYGFRQLPGDEGLDYSTFRASDAYRERDDMVYVGANDGMLHGFSAEDGTEQIAYMPGEFIQAEADAPSPITQLMDPDYNHRYFVDGTPTVRDAYIPHDGSDQWRTVLVGTTGAGGRTVFALDVTDPDDFDTDSVLWEFTHEDLGLGVTQPEIARLESGEWVALFGNGYGASDTASLFVVDLASGELLAQVETGEGTGGHPNAMAAPYVTDWPNNNRQASRAYVGDLLGNLWRVELSDLELGDLDSDQSDALHHVFVTDDQPITTKPTGRPHPNEPQHFVVTFGTGSYFLETDANDTQVQSLYAVIDREEDEPVEYGDLLEQSIIWQGEHTFGEGDDEVTYENLRATSNHQMLDNEPGWRMELVYEDNELGERVISRPSIISSPGRTGVRFTTLLPDDDPCGVGRTGYVMELDLATGSRPEQPVFDLDGDGQFDDTDTINVPGEGDIPISGVGDVIQGEDLSTVIDEDGVEKIVEPIDEEGDEHLDPSLGLLGDISATGRQAWEQLR